MIKIDEIKLYFKKLQRIITSDAAFTFFKYKLVERNKIDDILCCILASLPDDYKAIMKTSRKRNFHSMMSYSLLQTALKQQFTLDNNLYVIKHKHAVDIIEAILKTIEKDIHFIEKENQ